MSEDKKAAPLSLTQLENNGSNSIELPSPSFHESLALRPFHATAHPLDPPPGCGTHDRCADFLPSDEMCIVAVTLAPLSPWDFESTIHGLRTGGGRSGRKLLSHRLSVLCTPLPPCRPLRIWARSIVRGKARDRRRGKMCTWAQMIWEGKQATDADGGGLPLNFVASLASKKV